MSEFSEVKRHFRIGLVQGINTVAPSARHAEKWTAQFYKTLELDSVPKEPRLINSFKVGADPEFVFASAEYGRMNAEDVGLKTGLAFGADMNGRLVELRPEPSRFVLEVLASLLAELRWLYVSVPDTRKLDWLSGAFLFKDGIGGHVHLGRKWQGKSVNKWAKFYKQKHDRHTPRPTRMDEPQCPSAVKALDLVSRVLATLGGFPLEDMEHRARGDQHGQKYGLPSDIRAQAHGYEYRTFPSWLSSPWLAYLVMTLSKLVVYDPDLLPQPGDMKRLPQDWCRKLVENLLAYYKSIDDDARIAQIVLGKQGIPIHAARDFKEKWGLGAHLAVLKQPEFIPLTIGWTEEGKQELLEHLLTEASLVQVPKPTWNTTIPKGYQSLLAAYGNTRGVKGIGELFWDIVQPEVAEWAVAVGNGDTFQINSYFWDKAPVASKAILDGLDIPYVIEPKGQLGRSTMLLIPAPYREGDKLKFARKFLLSGVFPLWAIGEVKPDSYQQWKMQAKVLNVKASSRVILMKEDK